MTQAGACVILLAGKTSCAGNPLVSDFVLTAQKLEKLGFSYHKEGVIVAEPLEKKVFSLRNHT